MYVDLVWTLKFQKDLFYKNVPLEFGKKELTGLTTKVTSMSLH